MSLSVAKVFAQSQNRQILETCGAGYGQKKRAKAASLDCFDARAGAGDLQIQAANQVFSGRCFHLAEGADSGSDPLEFAPVFKAARLEQVAG